MTGPHRTWRVTYRAAGQDSPWAGTTYVWPDAWMVSGGQSSFGAGEAFANYLLFHNEREALAVCEALNRVTEAGA